MKKLILAAILSTACATGANAATVFGVDEFNNLTSFDSATPAVQQSSVAITGLDSSLQAIDFRPLNNVLYGISNNRIVYTVNTLTGVATAVSGQLAIEGSTFGFDFNPTIDRLRIVSNTNGNYVFNPNNGALTTATPLAFAGSSNDPGVTAAAYTSSVFGAPGGSTQLYVIDSDFDLLAQQNNNGGVLTPVGATGVNLGSRTSFDILGSDAFASNGRNFYRVNLGTGATTLLGRTDESLFGIAIAGVNGAVPEPATWGMMIVGFGAVGATMRRRRRAAAGQALAL